MIIASIIFFFFSIYVKKCLLNQKTLKAGLYIVDLLFFVYVCISLITIFVDFKICPFAPHIGACMKAGIHYSSLSGFPHTLYLGNIIVTLVITVFFFVCIIILRKRELNNEKK